MVCSSRATMQTGTGRPPDAEMNSKSRAHISLKGSPSIRRSLSGWRLGAVEGPNRVAGGHRRVWEPESTPATLFGPTGGPLQAFPQDSPPQRVRRGPRKHRHDLGALRTWRIEWPPQPPAPNWHAHAAGPRIYGRGRPAGSGVSFSPMGGPELATPDAPRSWAGALIAHPRVPGSPRAPGCRSGSSGTRAPVGHGTTCPATAVRPNRL